ncbi:MAG TPA: sigma-70 family RNA polymerase sigma factor [Mycobacteriales bacterium]|nr:sigma-70 family RNA polymerase sigma factor [Mycobacteriales bacterium]
MRDATAFGVLARERLPALYALARRLLPEDPEDLVQECLLRAFRRFGDLRDDVAAERWFNAILVNCAKDRYRAAARSPEVPVDPVDEFSLFRTIAAADPFPYSDSLHVDFLCRFGSEDLHAVLGELPELYRVPLVLVHMEGYPTREVASLLQVPVGTLLARLHRGRKLLERRLWDYAVDHDLLKDGDR